MLTRRFIALCAAGALGLVHLLPASAQPLIDRVPDDAVFYMGWAGTSAVADEYAQSTFKEVVDLIEPQKIKEAWRNAMPMLRHAIDDPNFNEHYRHVAGMMSASCEGAFATYLTLKPIKPDMDLERDFVPPGVALWWEPATPQGREDLLAGLKFYADQSPLPTELVSDGPVVGLLINNPSVPSANALDADAAGSLAQGVSFASAWSKLEQPGPIVTYLDLPEITRYIRQAVSIEVDNDNDLQTVNAVLDVVNLEGLGVALLTSGYDGRRWRTEAFLAAAAPRTGIATVFESPAIDADALALAPRTASWSAVMSFDLGKLMDVVRDAVTAAGPEASDPFERGLAQVSGMVGIDVEEQLLRGLGTTWAMYLDPDTAGHGYTGLTLINPLADPDGVERGLRAAQMFGNLGAMQALAEQPVKIQVYTNNVEGLDIHTLGTPLISPSWAVVDGNLVVGMYPHTILAAKDRLAQPGSILDNPDYAALREQIGTRRLTGVTWIDLPQTVDQAYPGLISTESLVTGLASMATGQPMPMLLPPLGRLRPHLEPAHSLGWIDDDGWHSVSQSPFPGATLLAPQADGAAAYAPMMMGITLPAFGAARRTSRQMSDSTQARGIHQSMVTYAQTNDGNLPDDIGLLIEGNFFTPEYAVSAGSGTQLPRDIDDWPIEAQADWVRANADFILVPGLTDDLDTNKIPVFLRPDIYNEWGEVGRGTITRNDNSTSFETDYDLVEADLIMQIGMTMQQLIDRQEALANR